MRVGYALLTTLSFSLTQCVVANSKTFYLKDQWRGNDFFQGWNWETETDPTHGRVNYVSQDEAISKNLACGMFTSPHPCVPHSLLTVRVDPHRPPFQWREVNSSCVQTIGPLSMHTPVGVTACASRRRQYMTRQ